MELNYKSFGAGEPVVILHGLFGMLDNWQTIAKKLADKHKVFIVDQRDHGRSPHTDAINYPLMADDLLNFLDDHSIYDPTIIGHSMGGKTAMQLALDYPDMLEKLVIVDIAPVKYAGHHDAIFESLLSVDLSKATSRKEVEQQLETMIKTYSVRQFLMKNLTRNGSGGYSWKMNLPILYRDYRDLLEDVDGQLPFAKPSLFIRGGQSEYVPDETIPLIHERFPGAEIVTFPGAGHWVHADVPNELLAEIRHFLED